MVKPKLKFKLWVLNKKYKKIMYNILNSLLNMWLRIKKSTEKYIKSFGIKESQKSNNIYKHKNKQKMLQIVNNILNMWLRIKKSTEKYIKSFEISHGQTNNSLVKKVTKIAEKANIKRCEGASIFAIAVGEAIKKGVENGSIKVENQTFVEKSDNENTSDYQTETIPNVEMAEQEKEFKKIMASISNKKCNQDGLHLKIATKDFLAQPTSQDKLKALADATQKFQKNEYHGYVELYDKSLAELYEIDKNPTLNLDAFTNTQVKINPELYNTKEKKEIAKTTKSLCDTIEYNTQLHVHKFDPTTRSVHLSILPYTWVEHFVGTFLMSILGFVSGSMLVVLLILLIGVIAYLIVSRCKSKEKPEV